MFLNATVSASVGIWH